MASQAHSNIKVTTSPKGATAADGSASAGPPGSPKLGQCLCSPTTHQGSFRCRFHRTAGSSAWIMKRSNSMPAKNSAPVAASFSPKSVEST
ncbi:Set1 complex component ash2 like [Melia azedarach]|uniref:Set1 complex component ash2 like n=1 Tax=Melia azedarach TaxID=155640 RepID=A0ACC1XB82_MELAZ|nr:Set1 complex component ash2 like [Melia azedarach]